MKFSDYNLRNLNQFDNRKRIFLVFFWVTILLILGKLIESIFFNNVPFPDILRDLAYGLVILFFEILVLEKANSLK